MKVAVTAASGGLGQAILKYLCAEIGAANTIAVARSPDRVSRTDIEVRRGDYQSVTELTAAFTAIDTVVMISAPVGDWDRISMHRNVIEAAKQAGVGKILYTSIVGNGLEEDTWFWKTQQINRQAEIDLRESGLEWVVARNGLYIEKDLAHIVEAKSIGVYHNIVGDGKCGYISVDELAYATAKLAIDNHSNGQVFNLVGEILTQARLVELANQVFAMDVRYEVISDEENIAELMKDPKIAARGEKVARMLTGCFQAVRIGAFDVESDFQRAAGRAVKSTLEMIREQQQIMAG
ncbi:MAG: NAD(P)H-binding protein [Gammaproteobacteria bacterium]|nr:NAD(P)H-binding protein [Gammaproteobacteria bacterium]MDP7296681.1 NAD(P)H-binding protein [Gammaproteobacteria bacterium]MDP7419561.1 NAD(P)H-binding protein [Gammaproteobacteria bacterium]MDP7660563.1 NAD(P)H-binding protein [Gammaproteobacteria bacterium]HJP38337.1 NAD(P)H-binding protein [Gammaproteobacteria bacterium]